MAYAAMQACPLGTVAGVEMIRFNTFYIIGRIHQAIRWVRGDGHSATEIVYRKTKGMPLARVAPGLESIMRHLKVGLYVFDKIEDLVGGIQAGLNSVDHESHINIGNFFMLAVHQEDQENGSHPAAFGGPLRSRGHERALSKEGSQGVKGGALHAEHSSQGTEVDAP